MNTTQLSSLLHYIAHTPIGLNLKVVNLHAHASWLAVGGSIFDEIWLFF